MKKKEQDALQSASESAAKANALEAEQANLRSKVEELSGLLHAAEEEASKYKEDLLKVDPSNNF